MNINSAHSLRLGLTALASICVASAAAAQNSTWRHGVLTFKSDAGFVTMATQHDFAAKNGIKLKLVPLKNETLALRALVAGELDSYDGSPPFQADGRGLNLKVIGCHWVKLEHALFVQKSINKVSDLKGKSIATSAPGSLPSLLAQATLAHYNVPLSDVRLAQVGGDADRYRALTGGVVAGAVVSAEYTPFVTRDNVKNLVSMRDILPNYLRLCYVTTAQKVEQHPDEVAKFLATEMVALKYALSHKDETVALSQKASGEKSGDPRAAFMFDDVVQNHAIDPTLPLSVDKMKDMQQLLLKAGILKKQIEIDSMVAPGPRKKALTEAAKQDRDRTRSAP